MRGLAGRGGLRAGLRPRGGLLAAVSAAGGAHGAVGAAVLLGLGRLLRLVLAGRARGRLRGRGELGPAVGAARAQRARARREDRVPAERVGAPQVHRRDEHLLQGDAALGLDEARRALAPAHRRCEFTRAH